MLSTERASPRLGRVFVMNGAKSITRARERNVPEAGSVLSLHADGSDGCHDF